MDARDLLLLQHAAVHAAVVSGSKNPTLADRTFSGLSDVQLRLRPAPDTNSVAWLIWHLARSEDVFVGVVLAGQSQIWDETWRKRLGVDRLDIGTSMTADEVTALSETIDLAGLRDYRDAVGRRTRELVNAGSSLGWEGQTSGEDLKRATTAGAFGRAATLLERIFTGRPRAAVLGGITVIHNAEHIGEALTVRGLGGFGLGV